MDAEPERSKQNQYLFTVAQHYFVLPLFTNTRQNSAFYTTIDYFTQKI